MTPIFRWTRLSPTGSGPCARSSCGLSLVGNDRLILYGGERVARTPLDDDEACWGLNLKTITWNKIDCSNGPPPRLAQAQAACDNKLYIFGGRAGVAMDEKAMNDLWVLDCSGKPGTETWSKIVPKGDDTDSSIPEARSFHRMECIGRSLYIFGGGASGRLADLHRFDLNSETFHNLGTSQLRGRGGPNLLPLAKGQKLGFVAGFAGEETADGQRYDLTTEQWEPNLMSELEGMRPRSVCVCGSFPSVGVSIIFGGEVNPSDRGHEGAGGFANDIVVLNETDGSLLTTTPAKSDEQWPEQRGWSDAAAVDNGDGTGHLYLFGGLSGDDKDPRRLDDLWRLDITKT